MFISNGKFIFDGVDEKLSKAGKPYRLVKFIDVENYQRLELFANEALSVNIAVGQPCKLVLKASKVGYNTSFSVLNVEKVA